MCCFNSTHSIEPVSQWYVSGNEGRFFKAVLVVDLKHTRLPNISSAKMGLFGISKELQFRVCNHSKPSLSPHRAREDLFLKRGNECWEGCCKQRTSDFSLAESLPRRLFFPLPGSAVVIGCESSPFWSSYSIELLLLFINFHIAISGYLLFFIQNEASHYFKNSS